MAGRFGTATGSFMKVATPTRTIIAPRERCARPHPPASLSVSFFSTPIVLNTTIRQFTENPMRPKPTISGVTTMRLFPLGPGFAVPFFNDYSSSFVDSPPTCRPRTEIGNVRRGVPAFINPGGTATRCSPWAMRPPWPSFFGASPLSVRGASVHGRWSHPREDSHRSPHGLLPRVGPDARSDGRGRWHRIGDHDLEGLLPPYSGRNGLRVPPCLSLGLRRPGESRRHPHLLLAGEQWLRPAHLLRDSRTPLRALYPILQHDFRFGRQRDVYSPRTVFLHGFLEESEQYDASEPDVFLCPAALSAQPMAPLRCAGRDRTCCGGRRDGPRAGTAQSRSPVRFAPVPQRRDLLY